MSFEPLRGYLRNSAGADLIAALLVSLLLVPQALAYAQLAGLPAVTGLYASILPLVVYAWLGGSAGVALSLGPVAILSLMTAAALQPLGAAGSPLYMAGAVMLTALVGVFLLAMSILRLGVLANFLSHPVIAGFVSGSAILIAASQLGHLLGIRGEGQSLPDLLPSLWSQLDQAHLPTLLLGLGSVCFLLALRQLHRLGLPARLAGWLVRLGALLLVMLGIAASALFGLETLGVRVVGTVPAGLPPLTLPQPDLQLLRELWPAALLIALVGFVELVSIAQSLEARRRRSVNPDQELRGQAGANLAAAFTGGFPVAASFSRSALALETPVATPKVGLWVAALMLGAALGLAPLLQHLPQAVLAASILVAILGLIDLRTLRRTWRYSRQDGVAQLVTLVGVLAHGVEAGILLGVGLSLLLFLWRTSRPHIAVVGLLPGSEHFRNVERFDTLDSATVLSLRVDESLYFPNARYLEERIAELVAARPQARHVVLQCSGVNLIDASALDSLETIGARLASAGLQLHLSEVKGPVMDRLKRSDFLARFGGQVFVSQYQALATLDPGLIARNRAP